MQKRIKKVLRYISIYGIGRTINKVSGRLRSFNIFNPKYLRKEPSIGLVGGGQFQFSTIAYYLSKGWINKFSFCYDIDEKKSKTLAEYYSIPEVLDEENELYNRNQEDLVYIASNHASHTPYAIKFLNNGIDVFSEKPISVSFEQFDRLLEVLKKSNNDFYVGYNRPYSPSVADLRNRYNELHTDEGRFTLNCFISAHDIPKDHWYRNPQEGTRICGNVGHWIDLMIHIYNWRDHIPKKYIVQIAYSDISEPDDNITISITNDIGDLTSITISARSEPFEGINETINFQYDTLIAKIDDFRRMTVWNEEKLTKKRYWPKDVGHKRSVMQPFRNDNRDLNEIVASTELMLHIAEMVRNVETEKEITLKRSL
ncbi:Gfo/Idh/MocA family protein [Aliifodinibius salipaludis]|uniref:Gfo/Idh/MocA family protein n=1 Tax=Fodinibius salipaludis TaxID=2032627 RepID=UPI001595A228|nr:Gfo/Idh/MocA family oxidoreductase [Aliifodinibius salipaludis]